MTHTRAIALPMLVACAAGLLLGGVWSLLRERIDAAERSARAETFAALLPGADFDNLPGEDTLPVFDTALLGFAGQRRAYIARRGGRVEALLLPVLAPDAYAGAIELLVGIDRAGLITGVQVSAQRETPGLGARMEEHHGAWLTQFSGRSLHDPEPQRWALRRDGGDFDQLTGASITSRAVCDALQRALRFAAANPGLFAGDQNE